MAELSYRILLVESDVETRSLLEDIFFEMNWQHDFATKAEQGIKKASKEHYDLILCNADFGDGAMSGIELLKKLREGNSKIPFILLVNPGRMDLALEAINYNIAGSLEKPLARKTCTETIERAISHHKSSLVTTTGGFVQVTNHFRAIIRSTEQAAIQLLDRVENLLELVYPNQSMRFAELRMAIYEALANAVEHGNKKQTEKQVFFELEMRSDRIIAHIKDEGAGFEAQQVFRKDGVQDVSRGLRLINHLVDEVSFNITGNEINLLMLLNHKVNA